MANEHTQAYSALGAGPPEPPPRPAFFNRLWMVFVQPGQMFKTLALNPAWFPIALFGALVAAASTWLIPAELYQQAALQGLEGRADNAEAIAQIEQVPPIVFRASVMGFGFLAALVFPVVLSMVTYVAFVFVRGDQATFKQHLCVVAHTGIVTAVGGVLNAFVSARGGDIERTLSIGTFLPFLSEGYFADFLLAMDLFNLGGAVVAGIGLAAIDPRRGAAPTAGILVGLVVVTALIRAAF